MRTAFFDVTSVKFHNNSANSLMSKTFLNRTVSEKLSWDVTKEKEGEQKTKSIPTSPRDESDNQVTKHIFKTESRIRALIFLCPPPPDTTSHVLKTLR